MNPTVGVEVERLDQARLQHRRADGETQDQQAESAQRSRSESYLDRGHVGHRHGIEVNVCERAGKRHVNR